MFYRRFCALCEKKGVSPSYVAKEIGLSNSIITYWKRGAVPKSSTISKIANYFEVPLDALIGPTLVDFGPPYDVDDDEEDVFSSNHPESEDTDAFKKRVLSAYSLLNQKGQEKAAERIEELLQIPEYQVPGYYYYFYDESGELKKTMRGPTKK